MRHPLHTLGRLLVGLALGSTAAMAQTPGFDVQFKIRTGLQVGKVEDSLQRHLLGAGVELGYTFGKGRMGVELGYQYKPGRQYAYDLSNILVAQGSGAPSPLNSGDLRRNSVDGITLRASYAYTFAKDLEVMGGLQLGGARFRHEYVGQMSDDEWGGDNQTYVDTYSGTPTETSIAVAPFVGVRYRLNEVSSLELNVLGMNYKALEYIHVAGTNPGGVGGNTAQDSLKTHNRTIPHIELGWALRF